MFWRHLRRYFQKYLRSYALETSPKIFFKNISGAIFWRHLRRYFQKYLRSYFPEIFSKNILGGMFWKYFTKNTLLGILYRRYFTGDTLPEILCRRYFTGDDQIYFGHTTLPEWAWQALALRLKCLTAQTSPELHLPNIKISLSDYTSKGWKTWEKHLRHCLNHSASLKTSPESFMTSPESLKTSPEWLLPTCWAFRTGSHTLLESSWHAQILHWNDSGKLEYFAWINPASSNTLPEVHRQALTLCLNDLDNSKHLTCIMTASPKTLL